MTNRLPTIAIAALLCLALTAGPAVAKDYFVDQRHPNASDSNQGTEAQPWKTIARAGKAKELKPGDTVLIKTGLYRETAEITVSGEPGNPITFAAAPGAHVVIKGSESDSRPMDPRHASQRREGTLPQRIQEHMEN